MKPETKTQLQRIIAFMIIGALIIYVVNREEVVPRETKIEQHFSIMDGSHNEVTDSLKKVFEEVKTVKTTYLDQGATIFVTQEFYSLSQRYKAFADVTIDGKIINLSVTDL